MKDVVKWIGMLVLVILILNLILFALRIITDIIFWAIIILAAIFAYKILPRMKK